jgi:phospholipase D-like protein
MEACRTRKQALSDADGHRVRKRLGSFSTGVTTLSYTFGTGLVAAALIVWILVWVLVAVRIVRRRDLGLAGKLLWLVVILVVPFVGLFVYFLWDAARPSRA